MRILVSCPSHDKTTEYLSAWTKQALKNYGDKEHEVIFLDGEAATRKNFEAKLAELSPRAALLNGHGGAEHIGGHANERLVDLENADKLRGLAVNAIACRAALILGPQLVEDGAEYFIGYDKDFVFYRSKDAENPLDDEIAKLFLEPAMRAAQSIMAGNVPDETLEITKAAFRQNLQKVTNLSPIFAHQVAIALRRDMEHLVLIK